MWSAVGRRLKGYMRGRHVQEFRHYIGNEHDVLHSVLEKTKKDFGTIDFTQPKHLLVKTRQEQETLRNLRRVNRVAGVIRAREEFPEVNVTHAFRDLKGVQHRALFHMGALEPYDLNIDDETLVRVTLSDIQRHIGVKDWIMWAYWDRFLEGRPNRLQMKIMVDNLEDIEGVRRGANLRVLEHYVWCDVYSSPYPRTLSIDASDVSVGYNYLIGDLRKMLPDHIKLAPTYDRADTTAILSCDNTVLSGIYDSYLDENFDATRWHDFEMTSMRVPKGEDIDATGDKAQPREKLLSSAEIQHMKKLAVHLGKDFEELKEEMLTAREKNKKKAVEMPDFSKKK